MIFTFPINVWIAIGIPLMEKEMCTNPEILNSAKSTVSNRLKSLDHINVDMDHHNNNSHSGPIGNNKMPYLLFYTGTL